MENLVEPLTCAPNEVEIVQTEDASNSGDHKFLLDIVQDL